METVIREAVAYYFQHKDQLRILYPQETLVIFNKRVLFNSPVYAESFVWTIVDSQRTQRDFMDYLIVDLKNNSFIGAYYILWDSLPGLNQSFY